MGRERFAKVAWWELCMKVGQDNDILQGCGGKDPKDFLQKYLAEFRSRVDAFMTDSGLQLQEN